MAITIPSRKQHIPPVDGFAQRDFHSVNQQKKSASATNNVTATTLSVTGTVTYTDNTSEASLLLVPALRPFSCAALHVVGSSFVSAIPGLTKKNIRRFM